MRYSAQAAVLRMAGNSVCNGLVSMSFLSVSQVIMVAGTFLVFAATPGIFVALRLSRILKENHWSRLSHDWKDWKIEHLVQQQSLNHWHLQ